MAWSPPWGARQPFASPATPWMRPMNRARTWARHVCARRAGIPEPGSGPTPAGAGHHRGRPRGALRRRAVVRGLAALGRVSARRQVHAAGRRPVGRGLLRAGAGRHRGPRDGLAVAGARDALENALQDLLRRTDDNPWVVQLYAQDESNWDNYLRSWRTICGRAPRAARSATSTCASSPITCAPSPKPGGLFEDTTVTRLPVARPGAARAHGGLSAHVRAPTAAAASRPSRR